jgi:hypothetical protein
MANSLSILPDQGQVRTFACPACGETIALGCDRCRFCSVIVDPRQAVVAADLMDRVNLACSEAEDVRSLFRREPSAYDILSRRRGTIDFYLVPILLIRWWFRFGSLRVDDNDLISARHDMKMYAWYACGVVGIIVLLAAFGLANIN